MEDVTASSHSIGGTDRSRQLAACGVLLGGAATCALATLADWPLFKVLTILGAVAVVAWLVDGSSRRYMGPGLAALAVGVGITYYRAAEMAPAKGEHSIVYPLLGAGLLLASYFHPMSIRGIGSFLIIVGSIAAFDTPWAPGWSLVGILVLWAAVNIARINRDGVADDTADVRTPTATGTGEDRVLAGR